MGQAVPSKPHLLVVWTEQAEQRGQCSHTTLEQSPGFGWISAYGGGEGWGAQDMAGAQAVPQPELQSESKDVSSSCFQESKIKV